MGNCEICGKNFNNLERAIVEGVMIDVCHDCGKFGKVVSIVKPLIEPNRIIPVHTKESSEGIRSDYPDVVKKAREKKGLRQEELARDIAEKESTIHKIETGSMPPSFILARKIEQYLGIKLIEIQEETKKIDLNLKDSSITIGDLIKIKHRKA